VAGFSHWGIDEIRHSWNESGTDPLPKMSALRSFFTFGQVAPKMKLPTKIAPRITTPDCVDTRVETFPLCHGSPEGKNQQFVYDNLDFMSGDTEKRRK
jgi:hypothetical protein